MGNISLSRSCFIVPILKFNPDFVNGVKFMIFWHNRGLRVYFDLHMADFQKGPKRFFLYYKIDMWYEYKDL